MKRDCFIFIFWDGVRRPFNQRCGQETNDDLDAAVKTVRDMVSSLRLDVDARRRKAGWAANMGSIGVVRRSTEDVVCYGLLVYVVCGPNVCDYSVCFSLIVYASLLVRFERYSFGPEKQTSCTDLCSRQVDEILATVRHDITAVETNLEETWEIWWSCSAMISISTNVFCWL